MTQDTEGGAQAEGYVTGDSNILAQILTNLALNASTHTSSGSVQLLCTRARSGGGTRGELGGEAGETADASCVRFVLRDTGSGMSPELARTCFARYTTTGGTGLGLYLVQQQVQLLKLPCTLPKPARAPL